VGSFLELTRGSPESDRRIEQGPGSRRNHPNPHHPHRRHFPDRDLSGSPFISEDAGRNFFTGFLSHVAGNERNHQRILQM
jgi:hypothetical protein